MVSKAKQLMIDNANNQAAYKKRMADKGYIRTQLYITPHEKDMLLNYLEIIRDPEYVKIVKVK